MNGYITLDLKGLTIAESGTITVSGITKASEAVKSEITKKPLIVYNYKVDTLEGKPVNATYSVQTWGGAKVLTVCFDVVASESIVNITAIIGANDSVQLIIPEA